MHPFTKEYDGDVGLVYMYQRWYCPETGTFLSKAPMPREEEGSYVFSEDPPSAGTDPKGEKIVFAPGVGAGGGAGLAEGLERIKGCHPDLQRIIQDLEDSDDLHVVIMGPGGSSNFKVPLLLRRPGHVDTITVLDPSDASKGNPLLVILVHELTHAWQKGNNAPSGPSPNGPWDKREDVATAIEDLARAGTGMPKRGSYDNWPVSW